MKLPQFIPFKDEGTLLILSTSPPYYIGKVINFSCHGEMLDWIALTKVNKNRCIAGIVPGYSILIAFNGILDRSDFTLPESAFVFKQMANWYLENKIKGRHNKYLQTSY